MTELEWAKNEVALACKKDGSSDAEYDYAKLCFDSAMRAYESLAADGHSGNSWAITRTILYRLMLSIPLTPIEDTEDVWSDCSAFFGEPRWQCVRCSSLFKKLDENGNAVYEDNNRAVCIDEKGSGWHNGLASTIIDEMYPITMPYMPSEKPYKIYRKEYSSKGIDGEKDIIIFDHIIEPDGTRKEISRIFKEEGNQYKEITKEEFDNYIREYKGESY